MDIFSPKSLKGSVTSFKGGKLTGGGLPTLGDLKKTIPPGGLLNKGLRQGGGLGIPKHKRPC